jgi:hypothetical protein
VRGPIFVKKLVENIEKKEALSMMRDDPCEEKEGRKLIDGFVNLIHFLYREGMDDNEKRKRERGCDHVIGSRFEVAHQMIR